MSGKPAGPLAAGNNRKGWRRMSLHRADVIREPGCAAQPSDRAADGGDQDHRPRHRKISPRMHCITTDSPVACIGLFCRVPCQGPLRSRSRCWRSGLSAFRRARCCGKILHRNRGTKNGPQQPGGAKPLLDLCVGTTLFDSAHCSDRTTLCFTLARLAASRAGRISRGTFDNAAGRARNINSTPANAPCQVDGSR